MNFGKLIGKGFFSKVYENADNANRVFVKSEDPIKECMSMGWFPESSLFPKVEREDFNIYSMPFYSDAKGRGVLNKLDLHGKKLYRALQKVQTQNLKIKGSEYSSLYTAFEGLGDEFANEREDLIFALDACANYGTDVCFEISSRNVAVEDGKLVLLDCFFLRSAIFKKAS